VFGGNSPHKIVGREPDLPTQSDDEPKKVMQIKMTILQIQVNLLFYYRIMGDAIAAGGMAEAPKSVLIEMILPKTQEKKGAGITPYPFLNGMISQISTANRHHSSALGFPLVRTR